MLPAAEPTCSGMVISGIASTGLVASTGAFLVSYSNEKTKRAEILKIKVLLITQFLK
jgi:hypothetical protein